MNAASPSFTLHTVDLDCRYRLSIFPDYADQDAVIVNLDALARELRPRADGRGALLAPDTTDRLLRRLSHRWKVGYTFGGYLEDRSVAWQGSYLPPDGAVHLGIDINLPAQTAISLAYDATLVRVTHDPEQNGGWGGVAIFKLDQPVGAITHVLYAHLAHGSVRHSIGTHVRAGDVVAHLGASDENGGWYEHVHVQALTQQAWNTTQGDINAFDGYASRGLCNGHPLFPDPWPLLGARL